MEETELPVKMIFAAIIVLVVVVLAILWQTGILQQLTKIFGTLNIIGG